MLLNWLEAPTSPHHATTTQQHVLSWVDSFSIKKMACCNFVAITPAVPVRGHKTLLCVAAIPCQLFQKRFPLTDLRNVHVKIAIGCWLLTQNRCLCFGWHRVLIWPFANKGSSKVRFSTAAESHPKGLAYQHISNPQYISSAVEAETWSKKERWECTSSTCPYLFIRTIEMSWV